MSEQDQAAEKVGGAEVSELIHKQQFGVLLRQAREEKNISLLDVAEALNLTEANIKALENSQIDALPGKTFTLGYIRSYSRYLEIEYQPISDVYLEFYGQDDRDLNSNTEVSVKLDAFDSRYLIVVAVIITIIVLFVSLSESNETTEAEVFSETADVMTTDVEVTNVDEQTINSTTLSPAVNQLDTKKKIVKNKSSDNKKNKESSKSNEVEKIKVNQDILQVHVSAESWAEIEDANGQRLFYEMLKIGENYQFKGRSPFKIFLGNAPAVDLSVNHQEVDFKSHIKSNNVAHLVINETAMVE